MRCPICGNLFGSGRCPHTLSQRVSASNAVGRVINNHQQGRIDIGQALEQSLKARRYPYE